MGRCPESTPEGSGGLVERSWSTPCLVAQCGASLSRDDARRGESHIWCVCADLRGMWCFKYRKCPLSRSPPCHACILVVFRLDCRRLSGHGAAFLSGVVAGPSVLRFSLPSHLEPHRLSLVADRDLAD